MANYDHSCYYFIISYFLLLLAGMSSLLITPTRSYDDNNLVVTCTSSDNDIKNATLYIQNRDLSNNYDHSCYYFIISYFLLLLAVMSSLLIIPTRSSDDNNPGAVTCSINDKDINNATLYMQNRANLLVELATNASKFNGYMNKSYSSTVDDVDLIYGLALCRGDISADDCGTCLANATANMKESCTLQTSISFCYHCLMKISNVDFFEQLDTNNAYSSCYKNGSYKSYPWVSEDFANAIIDDAIKTDKMFASSTTGAYNVLVQCDRSISKGNCTNCLQSVVTELVGGCSNSSGGEYYTGSCIAVYSLDKIE